MPARKRINQADIDNAAAQNQQAALKRQGDTPLDPPCDTGAPRATPAPAASAAEAFAPVLAHDLAAAQARIAELEQANAALIESNTAHVARICVLEQANLALRERLVETRTQAAAQIDALEKIAKVGKYAPAERAPRARRPAAELPEHMANARDMAMRLGVSIKAQ